MELFSKLKIAMIGQKRIPSREGGVEVVVENLSKRLVKKGHYVICYNRRGKNVLNKNKINKRKKYQDIVLKNVPTIDIKGLAAVTSSFFATVMVLFSKVEIVHYHAEGPAVWLWLVKFFSKKKVIVTIHGLDWKRDKWGNFASRYIKFGEKIAVKYADEIIVLSENVQEYFFSTYKRNTIFLPNGVDAPEVLKASVIKEKYNLDKNDYILFLGRFVPEKGVHDLIEAYLNLNTSKKLVLAGASSNTTSYFFKLKEMVKNNPNVIFTGFVEGKELAELYSNAYLFCLPSYLEGMPLSLLEAMSYGNCCLVSNIKECTEVVEDAGVVYNVGDRLDLQTKMQELINNEKEVLRFQKNSQNFILKKYNWDKVVDSTIKVYKGVLCHEFKEKH